MIDGPVQFVLGDSAFARPSKLPIAGLDSTGRAVTDFLAMVKILDTTIAVIHDGFAAPRRRGITLIASWAGGQNAWTGVHVYQRVGAAAALDTLLKVPPDQRLFAVPLDLKPGDSLRAVLAAHDWMITTLLEHTSADVRLQFVHLSCKPNLLNDPRRYGCASRGDGAVIVRPQPGRGARVRGYLLVRGLFPG